MITKGRYNILHILLCTYGWTSNGVVRFPFSDDDGPFDFLKKLIHTAHNSPLTDNNIIYPFADDLLDRDVGDRQRPDRLTHAHTQWKCYYTRLGGRRQGDIIIVLFSINPFVSYTCRRRLDLVMEGTLIIIRVTLLPVRRKVRVVWIPLCVPTYVHIIIRIPSV